MAREHAREMDLPTVTIASESGKGRSFSALVLAAVTADSLWELGKTVKRGEVARPVFASFAGTDDDLRPFVANLRLGRRAMFGGNNSYDRAPGYEFPKSARFVVTWQRHAVGSIATLYLPDLFALDPGMVDPAGISFVTLPSAEQDMTGVDVGACVQHTLRLPRVRQLNTPPEVSWRRERWEAPLDEETITAMVPTAYLFARMLDCRTRAPILADGRFYLQLLLACLDKGMATFAAARGSDREFGRQSAIGYTELGCITAGYLPGVAISTSHTAFEALLADEVEMFFALGRGERAVLALENQRLARDNRRLAARVAAAAGDDDAYDEED